ncbi:hypothetical protein ATANTOWER_032204 [Ataeniobius toweri]|uniref:Uncharacterized protein n=1 Tax=Ataeniobius toweri TaxID=208326 RepID=A0ABU7B0C5_9TELE|nr:hypothetical protein [Ataeniobius toweri]
MWHNYPADPLNPEPLTGTQLSDHFVTSGDTPHQTWTHEGQGTPSPPLLSVYTDQFPIPTSSAYTAPESHSNVTHNGTQYAQQASTLLPAPINQTGQLLGPSPQTYPGHPYSTPLSQPLQGGFIILSATNYLSSLPPSRARNVRSAQSHAPDSQIPP